MLTRMIGMSVAIAALAGGLHAAGIVNLRELPQDLGLAGNEPRFIIIAADITAGREDELAKDLDAVQGLIEKAQPGDRIELYLIHSRAESSQAAVFTAEMPSDEGPMGMAFIRAKKNAQQALKERWNVNIKAYLGDSHLVQATDLFGFFRFVSQRRDFRKSKNPVLVLFTDCQQVGDGFNFERTTPSEPDLKKTRDAELMPDLGGVTVLLAGMTPTHNVTNLHWRKLQSWWRVYIEETGGKIAAITSDRSVITSL